MRTQEELENLPYAKASLFAQFERGLVLLGEPFSERLCNLNRIVVENLT